MRLRAPASPSPCDTTPGGPTGRHKRSCTVGDDFADARLRPRSRWSGPVPPSLVHKSVHWAVVIQEAFPPNRSMTDRPSLNPGGGSALRTHR
jgi:hypothetical protein